MNKSADIGEDFSRVLSSYIPKYVEIIACGTHSQWGTAEKVICVYSDICEFDVNKERPHLK